jgi:hypothetical protein
VGESVSDAQEREDLEALLSSPGWLRFLNHSRQTWAGDGYARKIKLAIKDAMEKHQNVAEAVQRVDAANDEVNALLTWPKDRVQGLLQREAQITRDHSPQVGRRGAL